MNRIKPAAVFHNGTHGLNPAPERRTMTNKPGSSGRASFGSGYLVSRQELSALRPYGIYIVYVIESAAYGVLFTSCLCQKPERTRNERVRVFDTNNE